MATTVLAGGGAMYAASQVIMGGSLWSLAVPPIAVAVGGFIHGGTLIGQGLSADQMHVLRSFLERTPRRHAKGSVAAQQPIDVDRADDLIVCASGEPIATGKDLDVRTR